MTTHDIYELKRELDKVATRLQSLCFALTDIAECLPLPAPTKTMVDILESLGSFPTLQDDLCRNPDAALTGQSFTRPGLLTQPPPMK